MVLSNQGVAVWGRYSVLVPVMGWPGMGLDHGAENTKVDLIPLRAGLEPCGFSSSEHPIIQ